MDAGQNDADCEKRRVPDLEETCRLQGQDEKLDKYCDEATEPEQQHGGSVARGVAARALPGAAPAAAAASAADDSAKAKPSAEDLASKHKESDTAIKGTSDLRAKGAAHEDPAEAAYMKSLLGDKDVIREDGRRVVLTEFRIIKEGAAEDVVYKLDTPELVKACSKKPFELVEGSNWKLQLKFGCYGKELVAGLQFVTIIKKSLFTVADKLVIGSFAPNGKENAYTYPRHGWNEAPSGMLKRGGYKAEFKLIDTDNKTHACVPYQFKVVKKK